MKYKGILISFEVNEVPNLVFDFPMSNVSKLAYVFGVHHSSKYGKDKTKKPLKGTWRSIQIVSLLTQEWD